MLNVPLNPSKLLSEEGPRLQKPIAKELRCWLDGTSPPIVDYHPDVSVCPPPEKEWVRPHAQRHDSKGHKKTLGKPRTSKKNSTILLNCLLVVFVLVGFAWKFLKKKAHIVT